MISTMMVIGAILPFCNRSAAACRTPAREMKIFSNSAPKTLRKIMPLLRAVSSMASTMSARPSLPPATSKITSTGSMAMLAAIRSARPTG